MHCVIPQLRSIRAKFFAIVLIVLGVYLFLFYIFFEIFVLKKSCPLIKAKVSLPLVVVHFDLKGAPPKLSYLGTLLPMLRENGANGLLMEYEDMFPYTGKLKNISSKNCYNGQELKKFLRRAVKLGFEIIPLVQTFGHMEHVLKLEEFKHLREQSRFPDSICPAKLESKALIKNMIEQVLLFHTNFMTIKYVHVGCDEVQHIHHCDSCKNTWPSSTLEFAEHIQFIADTVSSISVDTNTLIWDDMFRQMPLDEWVQLNRFHSLEPVYWDYTPGLLVSNLDFFNYHHKFYNIWISSAYKGAEGKTASVPSIFNRLSNHFSWANFILNYKFGGERTVFEFTGIILTGWSRYSHMDPLCELLPVSLPSLYLSLKLVSEFKNGIYHYSTSTDVKSFFNRYLRKDFNISFKCNSGAKLSLDNFDIESCEFPSMELQLIYNIVNQYLSIKKNIETEFNSEKTLYSTIDFYYKVKYINMIDVDNNIKWLNNSLIDLVMTGKILAKVMSVFYDDFVIEEYVNYKMLGLKKILEHHLYMLRNYSENHVWERNPIVNTSVIQ